MTEFWSLCALSILVAGWIRGFFHDIRQVNRQVDMDA